MLFYSRLVIQHSQILYCYEYQHWCYLKGDDARARSITVFTKTCTDVQIWRIWDDIGYRLYEGRTLHFSLVASEEP